MEIQVNGQTKTISETRTNETISSLIIQLGHNPKLVVVEFNGIILAPNKWDSQLLNDGDCLEIVTIVGGGS